MIQVIVRHKETGMELARMDIRNETEPPAELADYSVRIGVEKIGAVGIHKRAIFGFPRTTYNVLALVRQALMTLEPDDLKFVGPWVARRTDPENMIQLEQ